MYAKAKEREESLKKEIQELKAKLSLRKRQLFGSKPDKSTSKTESNGEGEKMSDSKKLICNQ
ncbi:MAG: hypothetical protein HQK66_05360 [Desulfamplus sp.]|nr:hypothetical protein [Desulfamplus sp.]